MAGKISEEEVYQAIANVMHPAIDRTLVDLGIIKNISIKDDEVTVTLALPFPNIPIKEYLVSSIREPIEKLGIEIKVEITEMTHEERNKFLKMEQKGWKL